MGEADETQPAAGATAQQDEQLQRLEAFEAELKQLKQEQRIAELEAEVNALKGDEQREAGE